MNLEIIAVARPDVAAISWWDPLVPLKRRARRRIPI
jgi:hypothetical protein